MKRSTLERLGIALILGIGLIHLIYAPDASEEVQYMGILFVLNFLGALVAAIGIWRRQAWGWLLGLLVAGGSIVGYVLSRSVGMPGHEVEEWLLPIGVISLAMEGLLVLLVFAAWPRVVASHQGSQRRLFSAAPLRHGLAQGDMPATATASRPGWLNLVAPSATLLSLVMLGFFGAYMMTRTELISQNALEEELGLRVTQIATTMMGDLLDVRMHVTDPEKANKIFNDHDEMPYLRVANSDIVLLPPSHGAHEMALLPNRTYYMFFPNPSHAVERGSAVTMYFGNKRLEPIVVQ